MKKFIKSFTHIKRKFDISEIFPITNLNTPCIFESKSGYMGSVARLKDFFDTVKNNPNYCESVLKEAIVKLDFRFKIFLSSNYENCKDLYLMIVLTEQVIVNKSLNKFTNKIVRRNSCDLIDQERNKNILLINHMIQQLFTQLGPLKPLLLGWQDEVLDYSELNRFLGLEVIEWKIDFKDENYLSNICYYNHHN